MDMEVLKLYGPMGVLVILVAWSVRFMLRAGRDVFGEIVASLRELREEVKDHTATDLEHHAEVREAIVRVEGKLDARDRRDLPRAVALKHSRRRRT